jgi:hypothetical protein
VCVLQRLRAEPGHVLHEGFLLAAILDLLGRLDVAARLQRDLVAQDLKVGRRVARGIIVFRHAEQAPGPGSFTDSRGGARLWSQETSLEVLCVYVWSVRCGDTMEVRVVVVVVVVVVRDGHGFFWQFTVARSPGVNTF